MYLVCVYWIWTLDLLPLPLQTVLSRNWLSFGFFFLLNLNSLSVLLLLLDCTKSCLMLLSGDLVIVYLLNQNKSQPSPVAFNSVSFVKTMAWINENIHRPSHLIPNQDTKTWDGRCIKSPATAGQNITYNNSTGYIGKDILILFSPHSHWDSLANTESELVVMS